jgi:uncharacterized protein (UPF0332 family)
MFDWAEYLNQADALAGQTNQAALRSAVSRAYYATYHKALGKLVDEGQLNRPDPSQPGKHKAMWDLYRASADTRRLTVGVTGDRLRKNRTDADYNAAFEVTVPAARACIRSARSLCKTLEHL